MKIKIVKNVDYYGEKLPEDMIGKKFSVKKIEEDGVWVHYKKAAYVFVLYKEFEIVELRGDDFYRLLDKYIDKFARKTEELKEREDYLNMMYYIGQKEILEELKDKIEVWK
ncbi:hypothetical protein [Bacillus smithii]|uniref:hypothetical protein n=1 Tax=Bacillus smithii TaxID=1479 RepID=UPI002E20C3FB|nr:hypothetical protein [Bacillus smithii]MED4928262.1 hypothetical protein [Bacillus smithii]